MTKSESSSARSWVAHKLLNLLVREGTRGGATPILAVDSAEDLAAIRRGLESLPSQERGLAKELWQGCLREWVPMHRLWQRCQSGDEPSGVGEDLWVEARKDPAFLEKIPVGFRLRPRLKVLLALGTYQLLFLDRVPAYAVFDETKALARSWSLADAEIAFLFSLLKKVESPSSLQIWQDLSSRRDESLEISREAEGLLLAGLRLAFPSSSSEVLVTKLAGVLKQLKKPAPLLAHGLSSLSEGWAPFGSLAAPHAHQWSQRGLPALHEGVPLFWIQGEGSQWACSQMADRIELLWKRSTEPVRVLEVCAGKGGKLVGTIMELLRRGRGSDLSRLQWRCQDPEWEQIQALEATALPFLHHLTSMAAVESWLPDVAVWDACEPLEEQQGLYDLVWVDAPCSAWGTAAKHPEVWFRLQYQAVVTLANLQQRILSSITSVLSSGGRASIFYTLCSITKPEVRAWDSLSSFVLERETFLICGNEMISSDPSSLCLRLNAPECFYGAWLGRPNHSR